MDRAGGTDWTQKQSLDSGILLTLLGFVQHTSASSVYKDNDNKISRQQKVLHMNKCLNV